MTKCHHAWSLATLSGDRKSGSLPAASSVFGFTFFATDSVIICIIIQNWIRVSFPVFVETTSCHTLDRFFRLRLDLLKNWNASSFVTVPLLLVSTVPKKEAYFFQSAISIFNTCPSPSTVTAGSDAGAANCDLGGDVVTCTAGVGRVAGVAGAALSVLGFSLSHSSCSPH